jgi:gluconokinase
MIGTSGAMRVAYRGEPPAKIPSGLWCYRIDRKRVIMGGALSDGGGLYHWLKQNLRLGKDDDVEREIGKRDPAAHGLTVMPFFAGERSTGYHENAVGSILGLRSSSDAIDIVQAGLESIAYRFADIFDQLNGVSRIRDIIASGGALRESPVWTQMIADVLGRNMTLPNTREASMRGAVLLALETTGRINKIEDVPTPSGKQFTADNSRKALYAADRKRHQETYKLLIDGDRT